MFNPLKSVKDRILNEYSKISNSFELKKGDYILTECRICNTKKENVYTKVNIDKEKRRIYCLCKEKDIENGTILVDPHQNLYKVTYAYEDHNPILKDEEITTICEYVIFQPTNPARSLASQYARIDQTISDMQFVNVDSLVLNFDQNAQIEQTLTIDQLFQSIDDELSFRFKPIKDSDSLLSVLKDVAKGLKDISSLEDKAIKAVLNQASGFLKEMLNMLIRKVKEKYNS